MTNSKQLTSFKSLLDFYIEKNQKSLVGSNDMQLTESSIKWNAKNLIIAREMISLLTTIKFNLEDEVINDDDKLKRYLMRKLKSLIQYNKGNIHNGTCPFNNAINFAKNEAVVEVMEIINSYI